MYVAYLRLTDGSVWLMAVFSKYPTDEQRKQLDAWLREGDSLHISCVPLDCVPVCPGE